MNKFFSKTKGIRFETAMAVAKSTLDSTKMSGFNGLRLFILADDYLDYTSPQGVLRFEEWFGQNLPFPMTAICSYNLAEARGRWDEVLLDLLKVHGIRIFKGIAGSNEDGCIE